MSTVKLSSEARSKVYVASYPDGKSLVEVTIRIDTGTYQQAHASDLEAQRFICRRVQAAIKAKYTNWMGKVEWKRLKLY